MTHISHWMLIMETAPSPPEHERVPRCFAARMHQNTPRDPQIPLDAKPQVRRNVSHCAFYGNCIGLTQAWKIVHDVAHAECTRMHYVTRISHRMHQIEVRCNVSRCAFFGNCTAPTRAGEIVRRRFAPPAHQNALHDPHISIYAETQFRCNVFWHAHYGNRTRPT
jgi:hypothetical protein